MQTIEYRGVSEPPKDIRTGEPIVPPKVWEKMGPEARALCAYHNAPHKQRLAEMYRQMTKSEKTP